MKPTLIETVTIVSRLEGPDGFDFGHMLRNVEVRVGTQTLDKNFKGKIEENELCGEFKGPGESARIYTIRCTEAIWSDYITVQLISTTPTVLYFVEIFVNEFTSAGKYYNSV